MKARILLLPAALLLAGHVLAGDPEQAVSPSNNYWKPASAHAWAVPAATHFAALDDEAAPPIGLEDISAYQTWLTRTSPRAFAVSANNGYGVGYGAKAMQQALDNCEALTRSKCWLYAVDEQVVYSAAEPQRVALGRAGLPESKLSAPVVASSWSKAPAAKAAPVKTTAGGA